MAIMNNKKKEKLALISLWQLLIYSSTQLLVFWNKRVCKLCFSLVRVKYIRSMKQVTFLFGVRASISLFATLEGKLHKLDQSGWLDATKTP